MADRAPPLRSPRLTGELALRVVSALVLGPLAVGTAYFGGWPFALFWGLAAIGVFWEWTTLVAGDDRRLVLLFGEVALVLAIALAATGRLVAAVVVLALGTLGVGVMASAGRRAWAAAGVPYAGALALATIVLRADATFGFLAIVFLFAVVWVTDILAYCIGRTIGGPKLMPKVSPNKTWSGALGGIASAVIAAVVIAKLAGLADVVAIAVIAALLSALAQAGDLFESFLKRRFGAKDSGHLIPGHGGLMDRLDGFVAAAAAAALIGLTRGGLAAPASGLLVW